jgi:hypothetical protein
MKTVIMTYVAVVAISLAAILIKFLILFFTH